MIVYADVLVFLNTLVDYFLLLAAAKITGERVKTFRMVLASFVGGLCALYIFLPSKGAVAEFLYKSVVAFAVTFICLGFGNIKRFFKNAGVFFLVSCAYAGVMFAFWLIFKPYGMVINNSVVYFSISPIVLVVCSAGGYVVFALLWRIFKRSSHLAQRCKVTVFADGKSVCLDAIADTGNSLQDCFGKSEIIIADQGEVKSLLGSTDFENTPSLKQRYRLIPCNTVSGYGALNGFRCDSATVEYESKTIVLEKPLLAVSKMALNDDYNAIINPEILR